MKQRPRITYRAAVSTTVALVVMSASAAATQDVLRTWTLPGGLKELLPDVDSHAEGDEHPEFLVGDVLAEPDGLPYAGALRVCSSYYAYPLFEHWGTHSIQAFGAFAGVVGDVDADGFQDYFGSGGYYETYVYSGRDGHSLMEHPRQAQAVLPLGDVNDDGIEDFLLGSQEVSKVYLYLGGSFSVQREIGPPVQALFFGAAIASLGDVDEDGFLDFAISAPGPGPGGFGNRPGKVFAYSGRNFDLLYTLTGTGPMDQFGYCLETPGDLTGDGLLDLVIGSPNCCSPDQPFGKVFFHDGKSGAPLATLDLDPMYTLGVAMDSVGDVNGNGFADVMLESAASTFIVDGHTREYLYDVPHMGPLAGGNYDWNDDGFPDYIIYHTSYVHTLFSGAPPGSTVLGQPCGGFGGRPARIGASGVPQIGASYPIHLSDVPPGVSAELLIGDVGGLPSYAPPVGSARCVPLKRPLARLPVITHKIGPNRGAATIELQIPASSALVGSHFSTQWAVLDPSRSGRVLTRTLRLPIAQP